MLVADTNQDVILPQLQGWWQVQTTYNTILTVEKSLRSTFKRLENNISFQYGIHLLIRPKQVVLNYHML